MKSLSSHNVNRLNHPNSLSGLKLNHFTTIKTPLLNYSSKNKGARTISANSSGNKMSSEFSTFTRKQQFGMGSLCFMKLNIYRQFKEL